jgi:hypothetical protein
MAAILDLDISSQNICCEKVLNLLKQTKGGVPLSYRSMVKLRLWDDYCHLTDTSPDEAFKHLDDQISIPLEILNKLNFKYKCTELCPFPCCLDELKCWEIDLIRNWEMITNTTSWIDIGMRMDKVAKWHNVDITLIRKWNVKRKKINNRAEIYKGFQEYLNFI